jgi:hypothetical protein
VADGKIRQDAKTVRLQTLHYPYQLYLGDAAPAAAQLHRISVGSILSSQFNHWKIYFPLLHF